MTHPHDPGVNPEDEGIPDLQDGVPEQQRASDPEQMPVPGDEPTIAQHRGTTANEVLEGESLDERLTEEEPEPDRAELADPGSGGISWEDPEPDEPQPSIGEPPEERAGLLHDAPDSDRPREQDVYSQEGSTGGLSAEEEAVRIRDADQL